MLLKSKSYDEIVELLARRNFQKRIDSLAQKYKNRKIVVYGAGSFFRAIFSNYDLKKLNIIGIADMKFHKSPVEEEYGLKTYSSFDFPEAKPDVVFIAMYYTVVAEEFFEWNLFPVYGKFKYEPFLRENIFDIVKDVLSQ